MNIKKNTTTKYFSFW